MSDDESVETAAQAIPADGPVAPAERYGRTPQRRRRNLIIGLVGAFVFAVVLVSWVVWAGLDGSAASLDAEDTSHSVIDARTVSVGFNLTLPRGQASTCAIQALNDNHAIVGWKVVEIPGSDQLTRAMTETVRTTEKAVTGLIYSCWTA